MTMKFHIGRTFSIFIYFSFSCVLAEKPLLYLYEGKWDGVQNHENVRDVLLLDGDESNLAARGWSSPNLNICLKGLWMGYEHEDYSGHSSFLYSDKDDSDSDHCKSHNLAGHKIRSVKIVGSPLDYTANAVILYASKWHEGKDTTYFQDAKDISEPYNSLIIVGNGKVELFTEAEFGGLSICVPPNLGHIYDWNTFQKVNENSNGKYLFTHLSELDYTFGTNQFRSFRHGCSETTNTLLDIVRKTKFE